MNPNQSSSQPNITVSINQKSLITVLVVSALLFIGLFSMLGADGQASAMGYTGPYETTAVGDSSYVVTNTANGSSRLFITTPNGHIRKGQSVTRD